MEGALFERKLWLMRHEKLYFINNTLPWQVRSSIASFSPSSQAQEKDPSKLVQFPLTQGPFSHSFISRQMNNTVQLPQYIYEPCNDI